MKAILGKKGESPENRPRKIFVVNSIKKEIPNINRKKISEIK